MSLFSSVVATRALITLSLTCLVVGVHEDAIAQAPLARDFVLEMIQENNRTLMGDNIFFIENPPEGSTELLLKTVLNEQEIRGLVYYLRAKNNKVYALKGVFQKFRFNLDGIPSITIDNRKFYALDDIPGVSYHVDDIALSINISAKAESFRPTFVEMVKINREKVRPENPGFFINYDIMLAHSPETSPETSYNGFVEQGFFSQFGVLVNQAVFTTKPGVEEKIHRDSTVFIKDMPEKLATLRIGDVITYPGEWGSTVNIGGIQYATNFGTQPRLILNPLPSFRGASHLPSEVSYTINGINRFQQVIPPGEYLIEGLPLTSGTGVAQVVAKDRLGREVVVNIPYYHSLELLRPGLHEYSYEAGFIRENIGTESFTYNRGIASLSHKYGFNDVFTGGMHGEFSSKFQTFGVNGVLAIKQLALLSVSLAGSRNEDNEPGGLIDFTVERIAPRTSIRAGISKASSNYVDIALFPDGRPIKFLGFVGTGVNIRRIGSVSSVFRFLHPREGRIVKSTNITLSRNIGNSLHFRATLGLDHKQERNNKLFLTLHWSPDFTDHNFQIGRSMTKDNNNTLYGINKNVPSGPGYGYSLGVVDGDQQNTTGIFAYRTQYNQFRALGRHNNDRENYELSVTGGVARMAGKTIWSSDFDRSFALVHVPEQPGIRVYRNHLFVGKTDKQGYLAVPNIHAYLPTGLHLNPRDFSFDSIIEKPPEIGVKPYFRSGVLVKFDIRKVRQGVAVILQPNGNVVPLGASIFGLSDKKEHVVGYDGEVFIPNSKRSEHYVVVWENKQCEFNFVDNGQDQGEVANFGRFQCDRYQEFFAPPQLSKDKASESLNKVNENNPYSLEVQCAQEEGNISYSNNGKRLSETVMNQLKRLAMPDRCPFESSVSQRKSKPKVKEAFKPKVPGMSMQQNAYEYLQNLINSTEHCQLEGKICGEVIE